MFIDNKFLQIRKISRLSRHNGGIPMGIISPYKNDFDFFMTVIAPGLPEEEKERMISYYFDEDDILLPNQAHKGKFAKAIRRKYADKFGIVKIEPGIYITKNKRHEHVK